MLPPLPPPPSLLLLLLVVCIIINSANCSDIVTKCSHLKVITILDPKIQSQILAFLMFEEGYKEFLKIIILTNLRVTSLNSLVWSKGNLVLSCFGQDTYGVKSRRLL